MSAKIQTGHQMSRTTAVLKCLLKPLTKMRYRTRKKAVFILSRNTFCPCSYNGAYTTTQQSIFHFRLKQTEIHAYSVFSRQQ